MKLHKRLLTIFVGILPSMLTHSTPLTVCDFEDYPIGTSWTLWQSDGKTISSTAEVTSDPLNSENKVLHIKLYDWGCFSEFLLPSDCIGSIVTNQYKSIRYQLFRSNSEADDYKQFATFLGTEELYRDEGYPFQGNKNQWQTKTYTLKPASETNNSNILRLGIHHNNSDYYIDNIQLVGEYDDYTTATDGQIFDYCINNTSSNYKTFNTPLYIPKDITANVRLSRYSEWTGTVAGEGTLNIYAGGERCYIGTKDSKGATYPNWSKMVGDIHVFPYKNVISNCGFYGLLLHSGTFSPDNIDGSKPNTLFANKSLSVHSGATLAAESGTRGFMIGELNLESGAEIIGYYKANTANSFYVVGGMNTDATLAGRIYPAYNGNKIGLIKVGNGTYTITGNNNNINSGITVSAGTLLINNDISLAKANGLSGATGSSGIMMIAKGACLGGNGNVSQNTELYGTLQPSDTEFHTLTFANYASSSNVKLTVHPKSDIKLFARSVSEYSSINIIGTIARSSQTQDFLTSDDAPRIILTLADDASFNINDEIVLLTCSNAPTEPFNFDIYYPKSFTFTTEQRTLENGGFSIVAKVVSLDDNPNYKEADSSSDETEAYEYPDEDISSDLTSDIPLRTYAEALGKSIGVAAASYRYDISNNSVKETAAVGREFNIIVAENEMKFDATEPSQNSFNYGGSDAIMMLADNNTQNVRGHTLAWHSQVPSWLSSDGRKNNNNLTRNELLAILKNHIFTLVGHYKGKIREWDVVNEVLDDDQSAVRTNPGSYKLRPSIWSTYIGEEFIDSAFVWAHRADPSAKLYINDYGVEFMGSTKAEAYFNLIKRLQNSGIPIDGCGLQCHITTGQLDTLRLENNIKRYAPLGLNCIITELDIALANPYASDALDTQAKEYAAITRIFLRNDNSPTLMIWGISDNHSWRQNQPLIYDANCAAKPAYYYIHAQLRKAAETKSTNIKSIDISNILDNKQTYNILGQRVFSTFHGITIENGRKYIK